MDNAILTGFSEGEAAMIREFCAENMAGVGDALRAGAARIELCDNLAVGGTTPSHGVIRQAVRLVHGLGGTLMVMIRPRGGDFAYDEDELAIMEDDIAVARELGADGVVFGCVRDGRLDGVATRRLARAASGLDMTFHMAFDEIGESCQADALHELSALGFSRVLTHGGPLGMPIDACLPHLRELVSAAEGLLSVMPGGDVTWENVDRVCTELGVSEAHGTRIVDLDSE